MKTIGLIGCMSRASSAEYHRLNNQHMKARLGGHNKARYPADPALPRLS